MAHLASTYQDQRRWDEAEAIGVNIDKSMSFLNTVISHSGDMDSQNNLPPCVAKDTCVPKELMYTNFALRIRSHPYRKSL